MFLIFSENNDLIGETSTDVSENCEDTVIEISDDEYLSNIALVRKKMVNNAGTVILVDKYSLLESKISKKSDMEAELKNNLTSVNHLGFDWIAGFDSAIKLDAAKRFAHLVGETAVTLTDVDSINHTVTIADAEAIIVAVATDYQTKFLAKQAKMVAIDNANSQAELDAVV